MSRVLLITKNHQLADYCRRLLPEGFIFKHAGKLVLRKENVQGILLFDSVLLAENSDAIVAAAAEQLGAAHGAIVIGILLHEKNRNQAFSLFPENLQYVQALLQYHDSDGKIQGFNAAEFRWFLENLHKILRVTGEKFLMQSENHLLAKRLSRLESETPPAIRGYPAFMQGRSQAIVRFREQVLHAAANSSFIFVPGRQEAPIEDFVEYYCSLIRADRNASYEIIDLAKTPAPLHAQAIWPQKKKQRKQHDSLVVIAIRNLQRLGWGNQAQLLRTLRDLPNDESKQRFVLFASHEIGQLVRRGAFRQELYSLLRKGMAELPPLYERTEDITHIAAEYICQRNYGPLLEEKSTIAGRILEKFDISTGYRGLFLLLDLLHDLQKSKGIPVFELLEQTQKNEALTAALSFLREESAPSTGSLFMGLAALKSESLSLELVERHYIAAVCEKYAWQVTDAARHLGISRKTLYDKMKRYGLMRPEKKRDEKQRAS